MRNNYSDIASGYSSNSVTALMKIKAPSTSISNGFYQNIAIFMFVFIKKTFIKSNLFYNFYLKMNIKSNLFYNFCEKMFIKLNLFYNFYLKKNIKSNLFYNFCKKSFIKSNLLCNFYLKIILETASKEVFIIKAVLNTTLPSLHIANLKGCNRYADWFT